MFLIIFATIGWTILLTSGAILYLVLKNIENNQKAARKRGVCPTCGTLLMSWKKVQADTSNAIGFRSSKDCK